MKNKLLFALLASIGVFSNAYAQTAPTFSGIALTPLTGLAFPLTYLMQESQPLTATIKNTYLGSAATISAVASADPQYVVTAETCTAAPLAKNGGTCTVTVKYVPTAVATASAAKINITRPTAGGNFWIPVTGIADNVPKVPTLPAATTFSGVSQTPSQGLAFAELLPGQVSPEQTLTYKNTYLGSDWTITAVTSSDPAQFEITAQTCTAKPVARNGGTCTVNVRFKPAAAGTFAAKVNVTRTTAGGNFYSNLAGIGKGTVTPTAAGYSGALLTPTSLTFPDTAKGSTSAEQTLTVKNTYAGTTWKVNSVVSNISSYKVTANDCSALAPGATCTIKVAFAPTLAQALNGTITINRTVGTTTSNMIVKATGIGLAGTAPVGPSVSASPTTLVFDATAVGSSQTKGLTLTNLSGSPLAISAINSNSPDFSVVANTCAGLTLAANGTCSLTVKFASAVEGTRAGLLTVSPSVGGPLTVSLSGNATAGVAQLRAEPGTLVFANTFLGDTTAPATLTVTNIGTAPLTMGTVTVSPASEFPITSGCTGTLAPAASCAIIVAFKPAAAGGRTGTLTLPNSGATSPAVVQLGGNGLAPSDIYVEPTLLDLGELPVGSTSLAQSLTFYNAASTALATQPLVLKGLSATEFSVSHTCGTSLAAGATCTATIIVKPTSVGTKSATLEMARSADSKVVQAVPLSAIAVAAVGQLTATPSSLTFPATTVGAVAPPQSVTLTNSGTANVTVGQMAASSGEFSWTGNCGTLTPNATCVLRVGFNPTSSGAKNATLDIRHNGLGGRLTLSLSGAANALPGNLVATPTSLVFADTKLKATSTIKTITLTNSGGSPVTAPRISTSTSEFTATHNCADIVAVGASCTVTLAFKPVAVGSRQDTLTFNWDGAAAPGAVSLVGNGIGVPDIMVSPTTLTFSAVEVGAQSAEQIVSVTNSGTGPLAVSNLVLSTGDFSQNNTCGASLAPAESCQIAVKFTPQAVGVKAGTLSINHNASSTASVVSLSGTATLSAGKLSLSTTAYAYLDTPVGSTRDMSPVLGLTNTGGQALSLGALTSSNPGEFSVLTNSCPASLAAGATCTVILRFSPVQAGSRAATITVPYGGVGEAAQVSLTGNGLNTAAISVSPESLNFPAQPANTGVSQAITVTNTGTSSLTLTEISSNRGGFYLDASSCLTTLAPSQSCNISVTYYPTSAGSHTATLTINSNATNASSKTVALSGQALAAFAPTKVAAGKSHSCAITSSGGVKCWGSNDSGQLGNGIIGGYSAKPGAVVGLNGTVASIAAGSSHTCALTTSGGVKCWGYNGTGQLGDNSTSLNRATPVDVVGLTSGVTRISAGDKHTCAVTTSGAAKCWGLNTSGQLGDGTAVGKALPTQVSGLLTGVVDIGAGPAHTCATLATGAAKCWGYNYRGELGDGTVISRSTPTQVSGLTAGVSQVVVSPTADHTCAIMIDGTLQCWGFNNWGQVGDGTTVSPKLTPVAVSVPLGVLGWGGSSGHSCVITQSSGTYCWGYGRTGELGTGLAVDKLVPTLVSGVSPFQASIAVGASHTCAMASNGDVKCWGYNNLGQVGDGATGTAILSPLPVSINP